MEGACPPIAVDSEELLQESFPNSPPGVYRLRILYNLASLQYLSIQATLIFPIPDFLGQRFTFRKFPFYVQRKKY